MTAQTTGALTVCRRDPASRWRSTCCCSCIAFRFLSPEEIPTRDLLPGVIVAAVVWQLLQHLGGYYVDHCRPPRPETSGVFAFVLGLLAWLYLGGQLTLFAAEINVVRRRARCGRAASSRSRCSTPTSAR